MFPARAAAQQQKGKAASAPAAGEPTIPKFEKVKGSEIKALKGGVVVRVAMKSGVQFQPEDIQKAKDHIAEIKGEDYGKVKAQNQGGGSNGKWGNDQWAAMLAFMKGKGKGKGKGQPPPAKKKGPKVKKELTPEQVAERQAKNADKAAKKLEEEQRVLTGQKVFKGEVIARGRMSLWVKPSAPNTLPAPAQAKLKQMNADLRAPKEQVKGAKKVKPFLEGKDDLVIYVRMTDCADNVDMKAGTQVQFKVYTDNKGIGGSDVKAA